MKEIARFRKTTGPAPIFKKRFVRFVAQATAESGTAYEIGRIQLLESGTIYAVKVELAFTSSALAETVYQEDLFLYCSRKEATTQLPDAADTDAVGDAIEYPQVDSLNGFHAATLFHQGTDVDGHQRRAELHEKFNFRRKCDRNTVLILSGHPLRTAGGAGSPPQVQGSMSIVIRTR